MRARRQKLLRGLDATANMGCFLSSIVVFYIFQFIATLTTMPLMMPGGLSHSGSVWLTALGLLLGLGASAAALYGIRYLLRLAATGIFNSYYREASRWLYHIDMLGLFVDENQTAQIQELIDESFGLRWMSPPRPRKLEDQLEYAACYFAAYRKLLYGPGRLDGGSVFLGSLAWYAGQGQCLLLGCFCTPFLSLLSWPLWILGGISYVNRLAVEACCIDYLLGEPREPQQASQPVPTSRTHDVGTGGA